MGWVKAINTEFNMRKWVSLQGTATINKFFTYTELHHNSSKRNLYASRNKFVRGQYRMKYFSFYIFIYSLCALWQATCNPIHLRRHLYYFICTYEYYCKFKKQDCTNFYFMSVYLDDLLFLYSVEKFQYVQSILYLNVSVAHPCLSELMHDITC